MKTRLLLLSCFFSTILFAQDTSRESGLGIGIAGGFSYYGLKLDFTAGPDNISFKPRYSTALSISYGIIPLFNPTGMELSLQASRSYSGSGTVDGFSGPAESIWEFTEIMVWPRLIVQGSFSPFIEVGVGIGSVNANEQYSFDRIEDANASSSGLKLGLGGGVAIALNESVRLDAYSQTIYLMKDVSYIANRSGWTSHTPAIFIVAARIVFML